MKTLLRQKTTLVALFGALVFVSLITLLVLDKLDITEFTATSAGLGTLMATLIGIFSSDHKTPEQ